MDAAVGEIYTTHIPVLDAWVAQEVVGTGDYQPLIIRDLDYFGDRRPTLEDLADIPPLRLDHYFNRGSLAIREVPTLVPRRYDLVGRREPPKGAHASAMGDWGVRDLLATARWRRLDAESTKRFTDTMHDHDHVEIAGVFTPDGAPWRPQRSETTFDDQFVTLASDFDPAALEALPCLIDLRVGTWTPAMQRFVETRPLIVSLSVRGAARIDASATNVASLVVDAGDLAEVRLPRHAVSLRFGAVTTGSVEVDAWARGAGLTIEADGGLPMLEGTADVQSLIVYRGRRLDIGKLVDSLPNLQELILYGAPGTVENLDRLASLRSLESLTIWDMFGWDAEELPGPDILAELQSLSLRSIPANAARDAKRRYAGSDITVDVSRPRSNQWVADNADNPFRDWDGDDHIPPQHAKRAAALYRAAAKQTRQIAARDDADSAARTITHEYIAGFNQLSDNGLNIDTYTREQIIEALVALWSMIPDTIDRDALWAEIHHTRTF